MNIFKTKDGKVVIAQRPNALILFAFAASFLARFLEGDMADYVSVLSRVLFITWGLTELFYGVNTWRRLLGTAVIVFSLM